MVSKDGRTEGESEDDNDRRSITSRGCLRDSLAERILNAFFVESPDLMKKSSETLAGRVHFVDMNGFTLDDPGQTGFDR